MSKLLVHFSVNARKTSVLPLSINKKIKKMKWCPADNFTQLLSWDYGFFLDFRDGPVTIIKVCSLFADRGELYKETIYKKIVSDKIVLSKRLAFCAKFAYHVPRVRVPLWAWVYVTWMFLNCFHDTGEVLRKPLVDNQRGQKMVNLLLCRLYLHMFNNIHIYLLHSHKNIFKENFAIRLKCALCVSQSLWDYKNPAKSK